jgi:hypothetical protein
MDRGVAEVKLCCKTNIPSYFHQSAFRVLRGQPSLVTRNHGINPRPVRRIIQQSRSTFVCQVLLLADERFFLGCVGDHVISKYYGNVFTYSKFTIYSVTGLMMVSCGGIYS